MSKKLDKHLPSLPGVYLFKDAHGKVIYIGKAKSLKNRVSSYFQKTSDWKTQALVQEYSDLDYILTSTETEALLLETELIQKYQPHFNILAKGGQPFVYIVFTSGKNKTVKITRNKNLKGSYFGPFLYKTAANRTYRFLLETFRLNLCNKKIKNGCLDYHLGNCPGSCKPDFDVSEYEFRLDLAKSALANNHKAFLENLDKKIEQYSKQLAFEKAKRLSEYKNNLDVIFNTLKAHYSAKKYATDIFVATQPSPYHAENNYELAVKVQNFLGLTSPVRTIDCFDISHFQSHYLVGSCVRFTNGKPDKGKFRRFTIKTLDQQNDYAALQEIVSRRYNLDNPHNPSYNPERDATMPDLILIDGGKGQLSAVRDLVPQTTCASLAKREERLFSPHHKQGIVLDVKTEVGALFIALRDYAHHFAISYHRLKRKKGGPTT